jgi:hypothetical protein
MAAGFTGDIVGSVVVFAIQPNSSDSAFASFSSFVSKPSVNQS